MAKIFFSYSHKDEALRDQLETHLALLQRQGLIEAWHDRRIVAGSNLDDSVSEQLETADVILILVSANFIASDYCYSREMMRALERHDEGTAVVIPVILKACDWHSAPFGKLLAAPRDGKPVDMWANLDEGLTDVAKQVRKVVEKLQTAQLPITPRGNPVFAARSSSAPGVPRSSNLRVRKEFTDRDKDEFLHVTFDYIARYFTNSLAELQARNPGLEGVVRQIDAQTFTATVYRAGKQISECAIHLGGLGGRGITYSADAKSRGNSFNDMLSVEADDQSIFLSAMGSSFRGGGDHLSQEGAAEYLWGLLIERLQ